MTAGQPGHVVARFPGGGTEDFFVSGFARGESELGGTAAVVDEPVGDGRVVLFSTDPNYRAWTLGHAEDAPERRARAEPCRRRGCRVGVAAGGRCEGGGRAAVARLPDPAHRLGRLGRWGGRGAPCS